MGFLNEIKKLMFGVKSVSKSAADKVVDTGKEKGREMADKAEKLFDKTRDKMEDLGSEVKDSAENIWDKAVDMVEDVGEKVIEKSKPYVDEAKDFAEDVGEKVLKKGKPLIDDAKDFAEDVGRKVLKTGGGLLDSAKDLAEDIGGKVLDKSSLAAKKAKEFSDGIKKQASDIVNDDRQFERIKEEEFKDDMEISSVDDLFDTGENIDPIAKDSFKAPDIEDDLHKMADDLSEGVSDFKSDMAEKAKKVSNNISAKMDETLEKAKKLAEEEAAKPQYKEQSKLLHKDLLEDKDDFFSKASAFADGNYDAVRDPFSTKPDIIGKSEDSIEAKKKPSGPIAGFEDLDGDGNEIIDDAFIIDEEE